MPYLATPAAPQLEEGYDSGFDSTDNITNVYTPAFIGTVVNGGFVELFIDGALITRVFPDQHGKWWHRLDGQGQSDGTYQITVVEYDADGNASPPSAPLTLVIDTSAPVTQYAPALGAESHNGDTGGIAATSDATPLITGQAEAGAHIDLYEVYDIGGSALVGTVVADANGTWSIIADALGQGKHHLVANIADAAGNMADSPQLTIAVLTEAPERPYFAPYTGLPLESDGSIFTNLTALPVIGYTEPGYTVTLYDGQVRIGSAIADDSGAWSITSDQLTDGQHALTTTITDVVGNISAHSDAQIVNIKTHVDTPAAPQLENADYDSGYSSTDNITNVYNPAFTGHLESGHVQLYLNGQLVSGASPNADGIWWYRLDNQPDGEYDVTVVAYDALGNVSAPSAPLKLVIDTTPPATPTILLAAESDAGTVDGHAVTHASTPAITGQTEAGAHVMLYDVQYNSGNILLGSAVAGADGVWQITSDLLAEGMHNLVADVSDAAGNHADPALLEVQVILVGVTDSHAALASLAG